MKKYKFIFKPLFFIFNLIFATWLVFVIEEIKPSDFGRYKYLFDEPPLLKAKIHKKNHLMKICADYKAGVLDSVELNKRIDLYLAAPSESITK